MRPRKCPRKPVRTVRPESTGRNREGGSVGDVRPSGVVINTGRRTDTPDGPIPDAQDVRRVSVSVLENPDGNFLGRTDGRRKWAPKTGELVALLGAWDVYLTNQSNGWTNIKVTWAGEERLPKHAFWLGWNGERFARGKDYAPLETHHPKLLEALTAWCVTHLPKVAA